MKARTYSDREFVKILVRNGFFLCRTKGDHSIYYDGSRHLTISKGINKFIAKRLIKEYNLAVA